MMQDRSSEWYTSPHNHTAIKMGVECTEANVPGIPLSGGQADAERRSEPRRNGVSIVIVKRDDNALVGNGSQFPHTCVAKTHYHQEMMMNCCFVQIEISICIPLGSCKQSRVSVDPGTCRLSNCWCPTRANYSCCFCSYLIFFTLLLSNLMSWYLWALLLLNVHNSMVQICSLTRFWYKLIVFCIPFYRVLLKSDFPARVWNTQQPQISRRAKFGNPLSTHATACGWCLVTLYHVQFSALRAVTFQTGGGRFLTCPSVQWGVVFAVGDPAHWGRLWPSTCSTRTGSFVRASSGRPTLCLWPFALWQG